MNWWHRDELVVLTHTMPGKHLPIGAVYKRSDGTVWRISRHRRTSNTSLLAGGSAPCWEVMGRRTDETPQIGWDLT